MATRHLLIEILSFAFALWLGLYLVARDPDHSSVIQTNMILGVAFAEAIAIYAFAIALMLLFVV